MENFGSFLDRTIGPLADLARRKMNHAAVAVADAVADAVAVGMV